MIKIFDNILNNKEQNSVEKEMTDIDFPWYLVKSSTTDKKFKSNYDYKNIKEYLQFSHIFYKRENGITIKNSNTKLCDMIMDKFLKKLNISKIDLLRVKANFQTQSKDFKDNFYNTPHIDLQNIKNYYTMIYYANTNDGKTYFFNKNKIIKKINSKKGRIVLFNGSYIHSGSNPIKNDYRIVINFNFILNQGLLND